ncbi:MAG TPA: M3 family metallopeptidase [Usitatibacter sp.]|jgi:thimet oligopeptidase|nr:M3 family metallopeptidase [Usitatibacter sp.]
MKTFLAAALAAALLVPSSASARALMPIWDSGGIARACRQGLERAHRTIGAMEAKRAPAGIFDEWNRLQIGLEDVLAPAFLLSSVSPDKETRDAAEPCLQEYTALATGILQDEKLYRRVFAAKPANAHQAKLRRDLLDRFEDTGVSLAPAKRARAKAIFDELEQLRQAYERDVREDPTRVTVSVAEMDGMPEAYVHAHEAARDKDGNYVLTLKYPDYLPFMANATSEPARKRYYMAKLSEGGARNLELLERMFVLRKELAGLYGLPSYADYVLRRRMAHDPKTVMKFLGDVKGAVTEVEKKELDELRAAKAKDRGTAPEATTLARWDVSYYQEKIRRERFAIDQEKLRKYFPTDRAVDYTLAVSQALYGITFREVNVPTWHPDVRYFDVLDAKTGQYLAGFYLDLFPREGKYNHAAVFPIRRASRLAHRTPLAALVANFNREGLDPAELQTLMHEFGHVLHNVLSRADYQAHGGTAVKRDFVEAPSQMFEEWARREQPLALFEQVCHECPQLTHDEIERLEAARRFGQGIRYARQWLYATFDMMLSTDPRPPLALWRELEGATPLGYVEGTSFPSSFSHIASNYAAGYYGYMWSEVLALDMLSPFGGDMLDPKVGARFRDDVLAQGGQVEERDMVRRFLGREPNSQAFFAEITGKR